LPLALDLKLLNRPNSRLDGANMIELAQNAEGELSDAFEKLVQEAARLQTSWQQ